MSTRYESCICICFIANFASIRVKWIAVAASSGVCGSDTLVILRVLINNLKHTIAFFLFSSDRLRIEISRTVLVTRHKSLINNWHILQVRYIIGLHYKDSASDLYNIIDS